MRPLTDHELDELEELCARATPEPWEYLGKTSYRYGDDGSTRHPFVVGPNGENPVCIMDGDWDGEWHDAALIATSRAALPRLISDLRRARAALFAVTADIEDGKADLYHGQWLNEEVLAQVHAALAGTEGEGEG